MFDRIKDLSSPTYQAIVRRRRYGVIDVRDGRLHSIRFRPWPKYVSLPEAVFWGQWHHRHVAGDRIRLYFNQPRRFPTFLAVKYGLSARDCSLASLFCAIDILDQVAAIKQSQALLCDAANWRISDRLLYRFGWERHTNSRWHRNYIKRFDELPASRGSGAGRTFTQSINEPVQL